MTGFALDSVFHLETRLNQLRIHAKGRHVTLQTSCVLLGILHILILSGDLLGLVRSQGLVRFCVRVGCPDPILLTLGFRLVTHLAFAHPDVLEHGLRLLGGGLRFLRGRWLLREDGKQSQQHQSQSQQGNASFHSLLLSAMVWPSNSASLRPSWPTGTTTSSPSRSYGASDP